VARGWKAALPAFADAMLPGKITRGRQLQRASHRVTPTSTGRRSPSRGDCARLDFNAYTTQIEPHEQTARCSTRWRGSTRCARPDRDLWVTWGAGLLPPEDEGGRGRLEHHAAQINPIDIRNSEGNLGLANTLLRHFADKLPVSRGSANLSDSTVLRNVGVGGILAVDTCVPAGLAKLAVDPVRLRRPRSELEVLAEAIQTVMRRFGVPEPYEQLKALTRGKPVSPGSRCMRSFRPVALPADAKARLKALTPATYVGDATELAQRI